MSVADALCSIPGVGYLAAAAIAADIEELGIGEAAHA